jgi:hypothetical protein
MRRLPPTAPFLVAAVAAVTAIGAIGATPRAWACSSCGCGDATLTATGVERPYRNRVRVVVDERYGSFSQGDGLIGEHVEFLRTSLGLSWSPHKRITLFMTLPWLTSWVQPVGQPRTFISGLGDLELALRGVVFQERRFAPHHVLWATGGLKMPTGYRVYDAQGFPVSDDDQPGSGSWDPVAGLTYGWFSERLLSLFSSTSGRWTTPGWHGYTRGASVSQSTALQIQPLSWGAVQAGVDWVWEAADRLSNGARVPNTGGFIGYVMLGAMANPWRDLLLRAVVDVPVAPVLNGQQSFGPQVMLQVAYDFQ